MQGSYRAEGGWASGGDLRAWRPVPVGSVAIAGRSPASTKPHGPSPGNLSGLPDPIEPASLRKASASFVKAAGLQQRHGDAIWRTQLRRPERHPLFIALEFQSRPEAGMAFWIQEYAALVLQMRRRYILVELRDLAPDPSGPPPDNWFSVLAEWETLMAARLRKLYEELRQEGREEGLREGRREGLHEGRREGRSLLRQLAVQKFGPEVVGELAALFDQLADPDRVEALAAAVIECDTGAEFIARASAGSGGCR